MSSRLLDNLHSASNDEIVHPREIEGATLEATATDHDSAQANWWSKLPTVVRRLGQRQWPAPRRGEYGMLVEVYRVQGMRCAVVYGEDGQAPIQFWGLPSPQAKAALAPVEPPPAFVWPVNVIRELGQ